MQSTPIYWVWDSESSPSSSIFFLFTLTVHYDTYHYFRKWKTGMIHKYVSHVVDRKAMPLTNVSMMCVDCHRISTPVLLICLTSYSFCHQPCKVSYGLSWERLPLQSATADTKEPVCIYNCTIHLGQNVICGKAHATYIRALEPKQSMKLLLTTVCNWHEKDKPKLLPSRKSQLWNKNEEAYTHVFFRNSYIH